MIKKTSQLCLPAIAATALAAMTATTYGLEDRVVATFPATLQGAADGGGVVKTIEWSSMDANADPSSGSAYVTVSWADQSGWQDSKLNVNDDGAGDLVWPGVDCRQYVNLEFDVRVDTTNSYPAVNGSYGGVQVVLQGWEGANGNPNTIGWVGIGSVNLPYTNVWRHYSVPLTAFPYNANRIVLNFYVNSGTNTIAYWVDNIKFTAPPSPPPTLSFSDAPPGGLTCIASRPNDTYQRQMVRTTNGTFSFHTSTAGPSTSYSMTITNFPGPAYSGFLAQMFLVPEFVGGDTTKTNMPWGPTDSSIDWNAGNVIYLTLGMNADGTAYSDFRYKTNNFGGQDMALNDQDGGQYGTNAWSKGHLATLGCATGPLGTWTLTVNNNTSFTWTAPDGSSTNFTIAADAADIWKDPMYAYFGVQPNNNARIGQSATFSRIQITGSAGSLDDTFISSGPPYTLSTNWVKNAADGTGIFVSDPNSMYWVKWTTPDPGFTSLFVTDDMKNSIAAGEWGEISANNKLTVGGSRMLVLSPADLTTAIPGWTQDQLYFSLFKRVASKLQVLLPGETAAPGTPSGKTGTPTPQSLAVPFNVVVNVVDDDWNIVPGASHTVELTCSDNAASIFLLNQAGATSTFEATFLNYGDYVFTATDLSDSSVAAGVSSSVTSQ